MDSSSSHRKGQKVMPGDAGLLSLPDGVIASIGEYLALPSRALFAGALVAPSSSLANCNGSGEPSAASQAVLPPRTVDVLDFSEVEKELATRLSDDDLGGILACVSDTLHTLKLANCLNITGRGLEPLRGSATLQFIDLSLVGQFESPEIEGGALSVSIVAPILQRIVDAEGSALRYVALPHKWMAEESPALTQFHRSYADRLYANSQPCAGTFCRTADGSSGPSRIDRCPDCSEQPCRCTHAWFIYGGGSQNYTCYECGTMCCEDCSYTEMVSCERCLRCYCEKCVPRQWCENGKCPNEEETICTGCLPTMRCSNPRCEVFGCSDCAPEFMAKCDACGRTTCDFRREPSCNDWEGFDMEYKISTCANCSRTLCRACCPARHCKNSRYDCYAVVCNDCQPEEWECLWCNDKPEWNRYRGRYEPKCARCFERNNTHCNYCRKKKLRDEDYLAPSIPSSYWISRGYDEAYVEKMESFLQEMKVATLKLKSCEGWHGGITLGGGRADPNGICLRHDDILIPHWQELTDALRQHEHVFEENEEETIEDGGWYYTRRVTKKEMDTLRLSNIELHSSVLDMLSLALKDGRLRVLKMSNLASSANAVKFVIDCAQNNPELRYLSWDETPVDAEDWQRLTEALDRHPTLKCIVEHEDGKKIIYSEE